MEQNVRILHEKRFVFDILNNYVHMMEFIIERVEKIIKKGECDDSKAFSKNIPSQCKS